jgi:4-amino-4-deoxy-L-arabinose transferase-like glycosyltransferase
LLCIVLYFPFVHHLGWEPIHNWDESLFAMRAAYMAEEGRYLPNYDHWIEGGPLHPNTKPPFTTWLQVLSLKLLGINEIGLRATTLAAVLATLWLFLYIARREFGDIRIGYLASFVLATTTGYVREHAARTGDQDVPLALYMLVGAYAFHRYVCGPRSGRSADRWLFVLVLALVAATMTKYVFGLFFLPGMAIYAIHKGVAGRMLREKRTWLAALAVLVPLAGWLAVMDWRIPGFLRRALHYEMIDRYTTTIELHKGPWGYYFTQLAEKHFHPWLMLLLVPAYGWWKRNGHPAGRDILLLFFLCAAGMLLTISFSETKTPHYDIVAYPPLAFLAGFGCRELIRSLGSSWRQPGMAVLVLVFGWQLVFRPFVWEPYTQTLEKTFMPEVKDPNMKYGYLFRKLRWRRDLRRFTLLQPGFDGQAVFYAGLYRRKYGFDINLSIHPEQVAVGDTIMACDPGIIRYLFDRWHLQGLESHDQCFVAAVVRPLSEAAPAEKDLPAEVR